jgi:hypothetical protein
MTPRRPLKQSILSPRAAKKTQEHGPFDFAQGRQECLCHKSKSGPPRKAGPFLAVAKSPFGRMAFPDWAT